MIPTEHISTGRPVGTVSPTPSVLGRRYWLGALGIVGLALVLRVPGLFDSLWIDETSSLYQARGQDFVATARAYDHPPLYFLLLRLGLHVTTSIPLLRSFSLLCGLGTIGVLLFAFRSTLPRSATLLAGFLVATLPECVAHDHELRQYAPLLLVLTVATATGLALTAQESRSRWIGLALLLSVALALHLAAIFFVAALGLILGWQLRRRRQSWGRLGVCLLLPVGLFLALKCWFLVGTTKDPQTWWMPPFSASTLASVFGALGGAPHLEWIADAIGRHVPHGQFFVMAAVGVSLAAVALAALAGRWPKSALPFAGLAFAYWGLILAYSANVVSVLWPRILLPGAIPFAVAVGVLICRAPRVLALAATIGVVSVGLLWSLQQTARAGIANEDLQSLADELRIGSRPNDLLVMTATARLGAESYWASLPDRRVIVFAPEALDATARSRLDEQLRRTAPRGQVYLVFRDDMFLARFPDAVPTVERAIAAAGGVRSHTWSTGNYSVVRYSFRRDPARVPPSKVAP